MIFIVAFMIFYSSSAELNAINIFLKSSTFTKCGIYSLNWRRVTYINTTQGTTCPDGLREVTNSELNKRACGRTVNVGCSSLTFPSGGSYTHICGRARGYRLHATDGFHALCNNAINNPYVDGHYIITSITRGSPRKHKRSHAAGIHESTHSKTQFQCPCAVPIIIQITLPLLVLTSIVRGVLSTGKSV